MISLSVIKNQMQQVIESLQEDLRTLRPGRASAELVEDLPVACYGSNMPLNQVASITANEQGSLVVQVWDKSLINAVESAITSSQLGFSLVNDGQILRLTLPPITQERRQELIKVVGQKAEAARIELRRIRSEFHQNAVKMKGRGEIREDELTRFTKDLNGLIDDYNNEVKQIVQQKEKELLTT